MQPDLPHLAGAPVVLQPRGDGSEPRLWVRRLAIWSSPGERVRNVPLSPGLNVIWSPDPTDVGGTDGGAALGHGSGKTLFCRLLRYCLGERRFATKELRRRIASALPDGLVGAEVVVDGTTWSIVRPLGARRGHAASATVGLDQLAGEDAPSVEGVDEFVGALTAAFLRTESRQLLPVQGDERAWQTLIALLTRDQECRFTSALAWRSMRSDSDSPVRDLSGAHRLQALRVFLGAIDDAELDRSRRAHAAQTECDERETTVGRLTWQIERSFRRLGRALGQGAEGLEPDGLALEPLRRLARARLAEAAHVSADEDVEDPERARAKATAARARVTDARAAHGIVAATLEAQRGVLEVIDREDPVYQAQLDEAELPVCPICAVPIDRALAEGCGISHHLPDLQAARERWRLRQHQRQETLRKIREAEAEEGRLTRIVAELAAGATSAEGRADRIEHLHRDRRAAWYAASRLQDEIEELRELIDERDAARAHLAAAKGRVEAQSKQVVADRESHRPALRRLDEHFTSVVRDLVGKEARGRAIVKGKSLALKLELAGERSTPAIESLKVLALDLAILCLTIEGHTHLPPFLIHDSPREADMGLSLYHRLFEVAAKLEEQAGSRFQYIVTTTTRPALLDREPCLTLSSAPPELRLMGRDL